MEDYTVITMFNKKELEVDRNVGLKVEEAWKNGAKIVNLDNNTINATGIAMIEHKSRPKIQTVYEIFQIEEPKADKQPEPVTKDSPGYKKFLEAKEKLLQNIALKKSKYREPKTYKDPKDIVPDYEYTSIASSIHKSRYYGKMAKVALEQASMGIGYVLLDQGQDSHGNYVEVAYVYPNGMENENRKRVSFDEEQRLTPIFDKRSNPHAV